MTVTKSHLNTIRVMSGSHPIIPLPKSPNEINHTIESIDILLNHCLNKILHHADFQAIESTWLGIIKLCNTQDHDDARLSILQLTKSELIEQALVSNDIESSHLFNLLYDQEFNMPGGIPYASLIGDYEFTHEQTDIAALNYIGKIAEYAFCPFISGASSKLLYQPDWSSRDKLDQINTIIQDNSHTAWNGCRESSHSKFISLIAPPFIGRYPYTSNPSTFNFSFSEEAKSHGAYCWVNGAFAQAYCLIRSFNISGWCTAIRGFDSGGKIDNLPLSHDLKATQCQFSDLEEKQLSAAGITTLCQYKRSNYAVIFSSETLHKATQYDDQQATFNAKISARLPYIMAVSRFTHFVKIIARDKIGSYMSYENVKHWLNQWLLQYVNANTDSSQLLKAKFPLAEAAVDVTQRTDSPGNYHAIIHLKPWLQLEELSVSMRLVTKLPDKLT